MILQTNFADELDKQWQLLKGDVDTDIADCTQDHYVTKKTRKNTPKIGQELAEDIVRELSSAKETNKKLYEYCVKQLLQPEPQ